jgi:hypothetical protein
MLVMKQREKKTKIEMKKKHNNLVLGEKHARIGWSKFIGEFAGQTTDYEK